VGLKLELRNIHPVFFGEPSQLDDKAGKVWFAFEFFYGEFLFDFLT
jgi:hypothetical protein